LLRRLLFLSSRDEFFQLTFDGGIADVFVLENTIGIDAKSLRDGMYRKETRQTPAEPSVAVLRPSRSCS